MWITIGITDEWYKYNIEKFDIADVDFSHPQFTFLIHKKIKSDELTTIMFVSKLIEKRLFPDLNRYWSRSEEIKEFLSFGDGLYVFLQLNEHLVYFVDFMFHANAKKYLYRMIQVLVPLFSEIIEKENLLEKYPEYRI